MPLVKTDGHQRRAERKKHFRVERIFRARLVDADVATDKGAADRVAITQGDRNGVGGSGALVVSHTDIERDFGPVIQMPLAAKLGAVTSDGESANFASSSAD